MWARRHVARNFRSEMKGAENRENEPETMGVESVDGEFVPVR